MEFPDLNGSFITVDVVGTENTPEMNYRDVDSRLQRSENQLSQITQMISHLQLSVQQITQLASGSRPENESDQISAKQRVNPFSTDNVDKYGYTNANLENVQSNPCGWENVVNDGNATCGIVNNSNPFVNSFGNRVDDPRMFSTPFVPPSGVNSGLNCQGNSSSGILKSKDVDILKLSDMSSIHSQAIRQSFFSQIEMVTTNAKDQIDLALNKMEKGMRMFLIESLKQRNLNITMYNLQRVLSEEYPGPRCMADAIRDLYQMEYHIEKNPRAFYHSFKTRFSLMCQTFPNDTPPSRTPVFKDIIMRQLPPEVQRRLQIFKTEGYTEELFLEELEKERMASRLRQEISVDGDPSSIRQVKPGNKNGIAKSTFKSHAQIQAVPPYCNYCKTGDRHLARDCPRNPPYKSCFDCLSIDHFKGDKRCPYTQNGFININRNQNVNSNHGSDSVQSVRPKEKVQYFNAGSA